MPAAVNMATFAMVMAIYGTTVQLGIPGGDSGELIAEACQNGVAHPPGYPLFTLLNNLVLNLNLSVVTGYSGGSALRSNWLSCLFGAIASFHISATVGIFAKRSNFSFFASAAGSLVAGVGYACMRLQWLYSVGSEVFALNNCLCAWALYLMGAYFFASDDVESTKRKHLMLRGAFVAGLCLSNQHTSVLFLLVIIVSILFDNVVYKQELTVRTLLMLLLAGIVGLSPTLLMYRDKVTVGSWGDTSTLVGLVTHVLRREYGTFSLSPSQFEAEGLVDRTQAYFVDTEKDVGMAGFALGVIGCIFSLRNINTRSAAVALTGCFVFYLIVFHSLSNLPLDSPMPFEVHRRFWMQPNICIALFLGLGVSHGTHYLQALFSTRGASTSTKWKLQDMAGVVTTLAVFAFYLSSAGFGSMALYSNMMAMNGPDGQYFERFGVAGLKCASEENIKVGDYNYHQSLLISTTDVNWNSMRYLQTCEGLSPSVVHVSLQLAPFPWFTRQHHLYDNVIFPPILPDASMQKVTEGNAKLMARFLQSNMKQFPGGIFLDMHAILHNDLNSENSWQGFQFFPHGLLWSVKQVSGRLNPTKYREWKESSAAAHRRVQELVSQRPASHVMFPGSWEEASFHISVDALYQRALFEVSYAVSVAPQGWLIGASATSEEKETYEMSLNASFNIFLDIQGIIDDRTNITTALNKNDVAKNFALVASRLTFLLATQQQVDAVAAASELVSVATIAARAVRHFLRENPQDPSTGAFAQILPLLVKQSGKKNTKKKKKKKTKKKNKPTKNKKKNKHG
jgi:hypothetical protein